MAYNDKKILGVLLGELQTVPDRCKGYREEVGQLLGDVLQAEREHSIAKTNVVKKIGDQVNTVAMWLYRERNQKAGSDAE
jgi:hypothetical protein